MKQLLVLTLLLATACGNAEIIAPETLAVLDTYPGNGSLVANDETALVVIFSADMDESTLPAAVALERTGPGAIAPLSVTFSDYDAATFTASYTTEPLPAASELGFVIKSSTLRAKNGAVLRADVKRSFRTP